MQAKKESTIAADIIALYDKLVEVFPDIERKGAAMPYTSMNGNMFSFISREGKLSIRVSEDMRNELMQQHRATQSMQYGAVMKEYVEIPDDLLKNTALLLPYFKASVHNAKTLRAKPTTKKK
jgi:hypothetical protein